MAVTVTCPGCHQAFAAAPHLFGRLVPCPVCQTSIAIPLAAELVPVAEPVSNLDWNLPPVSPARPVSTASSSRQVLVILASVFGGLLLLVALGSVFAWVAFRNIASSFPPVAPSSAEVSGKSATDYANLLEARRGFTTQLTRHETAAEPVPQPPADLFRVEAYTSPAGSLAAYVSPPPGDGQRHPAMIWIFGGFSNSIGETAWEPATPDNDQSARAFREAGLIMMYPSLRGGNTNPGCMEGFFGEVDDVLAAAEYLAAKDYVDPQRIYLGGHSTGGTLALLAAASTNRFRAVFAFGPVDDVGSYGPDALPFDTRDGRELTLRAPLHWLHAMTCPTFVIEGSRGNISCLRTMRQASRNPRLQFVEVRRADHFGVLAPGTRAIAAKLEQDTGPTCVLSLTAEELAR